MHGKKFAIYGDPDFLIGLVSFIVEMGGIPTHVLCNNAPKKGWEDDMKKIISASTWQKSVKSGQVKIYGI